MTTTAKVEATEEQSRALAEESREAGWNKPSFAKELFLGRFQLDLVHPYPTPDAAEAVATEAVPRGGT